jgi:hypothetical protein
VWCVVCRDRHHCCCCYCALNSLLALLVERDNSCTKHTAASS